MECLLRELVEGQKLVLLFANGAAISGAESRCDGDDEAGRWQGRGHMKLLELDWNGATRTRGMEEGTIDSPACVVGGD